MQISLSMRQMSELAWGQFRKVVISFFDTGMLGYQNIFLLRVLILLEAILLFLVLKLVK